MVENEGKNKKRKEDKSMKKVGGILIADEKERS